MAVSGFNVDPLLTWETGIAGGGGMTAPFLTAGRVAACGWQARTAFSARCQLSRATSGNIPLVARLGQ